MQLSKKSSLKTHSNVRQNLHTDLVCDCISQCGLTNVSRILNVGFKERLWFLSWGCSFHATAVKQVFFFFCNHYKCPALCNIDNFHRGFSVNVVNRKLSGEEWLDCVVSRLKLPSCDCGEGASWGVYMNPESQWNVTFSKPHAEKVVVFFWYFGV